MESDRSIDDGSRDTNNLQENTDSVEEQKRKLLKEIEELKSINLRLECSLATSKFRNCEVVNSQDPLDVSSRKHISDVSLQLKNELYHFAGIRCVKKDDTEIVFNISSSKKYEKKNIFAVQIVIENDTWMLGKWVMPMPIDLGALVSDYSTTNLKNISKFLKACKHWVNCYSIRQEQYQTLTNTMSKINNCTLQSDPGYTVITLELRGVEDTKNSDVYIDLIISLIYKIGEARPYKINVDSKAINALDDDTIKCLKSSLKYFKRSNLDSAFKQILTGNDEFVWSRNEEDDNVAESSEMNSSDKDKFVGNLDLSAPASAQKRKRKKQKRDQVIATRQSLITSFSNISKNNKKSTLTKSGKGTSDKSKQISPKKDKAKQSTLMSKKETLKETTLKHKKLKFASESATTSSVRDYITSPEIATQNKIAFSTPLHKNVNDPSQLIATTSLNISNITTDTRLLIRKTNQENVSRKKEQLKKNASSGLLKHKAETDKKSTIARKIKTVKKKK